MSVAFGFMVLSCSFSDLWWLRSPDKGYNFRYWYSLATGANDSLGYNMSNSPRLGVAFGFVWQTK